MKKDLGDSRRLSLGRKNIQKEKGGAQHMMAWIIIQIPPTVKSSCHHGADAVVQILLCPQKREKKEGGKAPTG